MDVLGYAHLYKSEGPFGKTERFYAVLDGTPEDLASRRDDAQNELVQNFGFASLSTDQEEGAEAEAHLKGDEAHGRHPGHPALRGQDAHPVHGS